MVWPELDQLLRDEDDTTTVSTPYTAAVLEYRVVFHDPIDAAREDKRWSNANGHAVHDAQHPCRYCRKYHSFCPSFNVFFTLVFYYLTYQYNA